MDDGELRVLWKIRIAGMKATAARTQQERREANFEELLQRTAQCFIPPHHDSGTVHGEEKKKRESDQSGRESAAEVPTARGD